MLRVCALAASIAAVAAPCAAAAPPLPGVPGGDSLLFVLDAESGALARHAKAGEDHYRLTLAGIDRQVTWFSDRPRRDAGRVPTRRLLEAWPRLGFRASPPNAALVIDGARAARDTLALELRLRSYDARKRRARFAVRALGSLGNGLGRLNRRLDGHRPLRFGAASLFVDNASAAAGCALGQPQLLATAVDDVRDMIPADGSLLAIRSNTALYSLYGTTFGGDGKTTFGVPKLTAPAGAGWFLCIQGIYPSPDGLIDGCSVGEIDYWALPAHILSALADPSWLPADGRTVALSAYPEYGSFDGGGQETIRLPDVPAPPGMVSLACVSGAGSDPPSLGQIDLYAGLPTVPPAVLLPADGRLLQIATNQPLFSILGTTFGGNGLQTFALPTLAPPVPGLTYYLAVNGYWPLG